MRFRGAVRLLVVSNELRIRRCVTSNFDLVVQSALVSHVTLARFRIGTFPKNFDALATLVLTADKASRRRVLHDALRMALNFLGRAGGCSET